MLLERTLALALVLMTIIMPTAIADNDDIEEQYISNGEVCNFDFLYADELKANGLEYFGMTTADNLMDEAFDHLGDRYRSGRMGPNAFDCSGFTSYVFMQNGIKLLRSSSQQYTMGTAVSKEDLKSGDLVFFTGTNGRRGVGHVGIVVENYGNGTFSFIHASSNKGVTVTRSDEGYYARRYVGARRIIAN